jgi:hypothetical protein
MFDRKIEETRASDSYFSVSHFSVGWFSQWLNRLGKVISYAIFQAHKICGLWVIAQC